MPHLTAQGDEWEGLKDELCFMMIQADMVSVRDCADAMGWSIQQVQRALTELQRDDKLLYEPDGFVPWTAPIPVRRDGMDI